MSRIIQSRADKETLEMLELLKLNGHSEASAIREGIKLLALFVLKPTNKKRIIGLGKFESNIPDLGSNKIHLKGLGKK